MKPAVSFVTFNLTLLNLRHEQKVPVRPSNEARFCINFLLDKVFEKNIKEFLWPVWTVLNFYLNTIFNIRNGIANWEQPRKLCPDFCLLHWKLQLFAAVKVHSEDWDTLLSILSPSYISLHQELEWGGSWTVVPRSEGICPRPQMDPT